MLGFVYPAYMSFKALETKRKDDDTQWLTYWIIFSMFRIFDGISGIILQFIPIYSILKLVFLVYLYHPRFRGANTVYFYIIQPIFLKYEKKIDEKLNEINPLDSLPEEKLD